jgi:phospholipid/cholesterol/gamma-HCH transport system substrate-binding protein
VTARRRTPFAVKAGGSAAFAAACIAIFAWLFTLAGGQLPFSHPYPYGVQAVVPTAVQLAENADVREAGIKVGRVARIANRGDTAVLALELGSEHAPIYRDAHVRVRTKTLVGENYVDIDPGTPQAGRIPDGGLLPIGQALDSTQIDQILSALDAPTRRRLQRLLDSLGTGLAGRGGDDLNRFLASSSALVSESAPALDVLGRQREDVAGIVADGGRVMRALGDRATAIQVLSRRLRAEASAVAARDDRLAATIAALPATLRQLRTTTAHLGRFAGRATPVLADLTQGFNGLVPGITALRPAAAAGRDMLNQLGRFDRAGTPLLGALRRFSNASIPAVPSLDEFLRQVNPGLRHLDPYAPELGAFFSNLRSATSAKEGPGNIGRIHAMLSSSTLASFPSDLQSALKALLRTGALGLATPKGNNAYPKPGEMAHPAPFAGTYPRLTADPPAASGAR